MNGKENRIIAFSTRPVRENQDIGPYTEARKELHVSGSSEEYGWRDGRGWGEKGMGRERGEEKPSRLTELDRTARDTLEIEKISPRKQGKVYNVVVRNHE